MGKQVFHNIVPITHYDTKNLQAMQLTSQEVPAISFNIHYFYKCLCGDTQTYYFPHNKI